MTKAQSSRQTTRKIKFLRYVLRRKQCATLTLIEIAVMVILLAIGTGAYFGYSHFNDNRIQIDLENRIIDEYGGIITFAHCHYINVVEWDRTKCNDRVGVVAFASRYHALEKKDDETCMDINEQIYCHQYLLDNNIADRKFMVDLRDKLKLKGGCPLNETAKKFPIKNTQELEAIKHARSIVHVQELFFKCPGCVAAKNASNKVYNNKNVCVKEVIPVADGKGWPYFLENCKAEDPVNPSECSEAESTSSPSLSSSFIATTMPSNNDKSQEMISTSSFDAAVSPASMIDHQIMITDEDLKEHQEFMKMMKKKDDF